MPPLSSLTPRQLRNKLELVERALEEACPNLVAEKRLIEGMIRDAEKTIGTKYSDLKGWDAIFAVLSENQNRGLTAKHAHELLVAGGYRAKDSKGFGTLRDLMNRYAGPDYAGPKKLIRTDDRFYLPDFHTVSK